MNRKLSLVAGTALLALTGCTMEATETSEPKESSESIAEVSQALEFNWRDAILAALGSATIDCLGTVGPKAYTATGSALKRNFSYCPTKNERAFKTINNILGVQYSQQGQKDQLGSYFSKTWSDFQSKFPDYIYSCPSWKKTAVINPPTWENVKDHIATQQTVGKENYTYYVDSAQCKDGDYDCNTNLAWACASGFGSQFLMSKNAKDSTVTVDPAWWLVDYEYPDDASNPFMTPGYYHGMSFYGALPGDMYGAIERAGERCSSFDWVTASHNENAILVPIDCDGYGWYCMSYCHYDPVVKSPY